MKDSFNIQLSKFMFQKDEKYFLELTNKMNRIVLVLENGGNVLNLNQHVYEFHKWDKNLSVIGQNYMQLCKQSEFDASFFMEKISPVFSGLIISKSEIIVKKNNASFFLLIEAVPLDENSILIIAEDITSIKSKELATKELENYLPSALKYFPVNFFWKDINSIFMAGDERFLEVCGLSRLEEIKGLTDFDCPWKKEEAIKFISEDKLVYNTRQPRFNIIEETTFANKITYQVLVSKVPLFSDNNDLIGEIGIFSKLADATQNKLAFFMANDVLQDSIIPKNRKFCLPDPHNEQQEIYLSLREKECLDQWVLGKTSKEIGRHLGISYRTVEIYIENIKAKLNLHTRSALINYYLTYQGFWISKMRAGIV